MEQLVTRKERRRKRVEKKMEENMETQIQKTIENVELSIQPRIAQSSGKLFRRDTYTVPASKSHVVSEGLNVDLNVSSIDGEASNSSDGSNNLTYDVDKDSDKSKHDTYNIQPQEHEMIRPVPAPRRRKSPNLDKEKVSSDTDKDIAEIDLDEIRVKLDDNSKEPTSSGRKSVKNVSFGSDQSGESSVVIPIPKPRKLTTISKKTDQNSGQTKSILSKVNFLESAQTKDDGSEKSEKSNVHVDFKQDGECSEQPTMESNELTCNASLQDEQEQNSIVNVKQKSKKSKKLAISDLLERKRKKKKSSKMFSSVMKLEKKKIPKISTILRDLKEDENKQNRTEEEDRTDFQIDSPPYMESVQNRHIYVQNKNGFCIMGREAVLRNGNFGHEENGNNERMGDSTVNTALLFQKYWSRSMMYFHGVLAGFGFSHAATVTAIMLHYNYEAQEFIRIYSCLSLKIHFIFYTLITFCIISCFDRIDIGHMNRKHWELAWKSPSMWIILCIYLLSFGLTFANQKTESRFDTYFSVNHTEHENLNLKMENDIQVSLFAWYHIIWTRDMLVLIAWLLISLTKFSDYLYGHLSNMTKYAEVKQEERHLHRTATTKTDYL